MLQKWRLQRMLMHTTPLLGFFVQIRWHFLHLWTPLNWKLRSHFGEEQYKNNISYGKYNDDVTALSPSNCHTWLCLQFFNSFVIFQWVYYNYCHQYHTENRAKCNFYGNYFSERGKGFMDLVFYHWNEEEKNILK